MTIGEFMIGAFLIGLAGGMGAYLMHLIVRGITFVAWVCADFIETWQTENARRPYDHERKGI